MNAKLAVAKFSSKRCFGLELEFGNKISGGQIVSTVQAVDEFREVRLSQHYAQDTNNDYWHVKLDRSCGDIAGDYGWELASFKASGIKDINLMGKVARSLHEIGVNVNDRCALHVHVEIADFSQAQLAVLSAIWIKIEPFICHIIPAHRADSKYCKFFRHEKWVSESIDSGTDLTPDYVWSKIKPTKNDNPGRRKSINICNYIFTDKKTIEFRFPESTLSEYQVRNWIKFCLCFVEQCKTAEIPKNLKIYDFQGFLESLGFYGRNPFLLLSSGLLESKIWLLKRAIKFSRSPEVIQRATEHLNLIYNAEKDELAG